MSVATERRARVHELSAMLRIDIDGHTFYVGFPSELPMQAIDLTGQMLGRWTVLGPRRIRRGLPIWRRQCSCGTEKWVTAQSLRSGASRSCGCFARESTRSRFLKHLDGRRFGRLLVLNRNKTVGKHVYWFCRCDCEQCVWVKSISLLSGSTKSCGCLNRELSSTRARLLKKRYRVLLTKEHRSQFSARGDLAAQILLLADESPNGSRLTDGQIADRLGVTRMKVEYVRTKFAAPHEIRRRAEFALKQIQQNPRRQRLCIEARRRYDAKPTSKARKQHYQKNLPPRVRIKRDAYRKVYKRRPEVRLRENARERAWRQTPEGKQRKRLYVERGKPRSNARWRERYASDVTFRICHALRARLRLALKTRGIKESRRTVELVGCTPDEFRHHIEEQFLPRMTWQNHGQWHIDHIMPCAHFDLRDPEQRKRCFHFSNLQPLWATENIRKGGRSAAAAAAICF